MGVGSHEFPNAVFPVVEFHIAYDGSDDSPEAPFDVAYDSGRLDAVRWDGVTVP